MSITKKQLKRFEDLQKLAIDNGLDPFPINIELVSEEVMLEVCAYALPTRARHWSHGAAYEHQKYYGEMGYSKVYEIILNNNPSYAFLLESNREIDNLLVVAHIQGHSDFFKNNDMFVKSDRKMVYHAAERASRIEEYIEQFGLDKVEKLMDAAFSISRHIDWHKGVHRKKYPKKQILSKKKKQNEFDDIFNKDANGVEYKYVGYEIPPHPEKDLLWFFANYAKLEEWEKDVFEIIREESYYFYPQHQTKIMNEGWASYWHTELIRQYQDISPEEMIDFASTHEKVVQAGNNKFNINPYYLGFKIFKDIEKRYGREKLFQVRKEENDISFIRNYLTKEIVTELGLFNFGYQCTEQHPEGKRCARCRAIEVKDKDLSNIINNLTAPLYNYGVPQIAITKVNGDILHMKHFVGDNGTLSYRFAEKTLEFLYEIWGGPIELETIADDNRPTVLCFDETGFEAIFS
jgi:stage V sporulation protein R